MKIQILPSLLAADFGRLADEIRRAEAARADALHLDIMDPHFVPNLSFGPDVVALSAKTSPGLYRNVHLMMSRPDLFLKRFVDSGAQTVQIHVEADCDISAALAAIRSLGARAALAVNPETPVDALVPYLGQIDEALVMTVHPGYGGQSFIAACLDKVAYLRARMPQLDIMVDGGVNGATAVDSARAGANQLVSGSYLFRQADMGLEIARMRAELEAL